MPSNTSPVHLLRQQNNVVVDHVVLFSNGPAASTEESRVKPNGMNRTSTHGTFGCMVPVAVLDKALCTHSVKASVLLKSKVFNITAGPRLETTRQNPQGILRREPPLPKVHLDTTASRSSRFIDEKMYTNTSPRF